MENEGLCLCVKISDFQESLVAQKEKRAPVFKGR